MQIKKVLYLEKGFYIMEKWQREQLDEAIKERGTKFLNDILNMVSSQKENENDFIKDILQIDRAEAKEIIEEYTDLANMMRYTFGIYRSNVEYFNQYSLQINSVVSTSLLIEQHIYDLMNRFKSNEQSEAEKLEKMLHSQEVMRESLFYFKEHLKEIDESLDEINSKITEMDDLIEVSKQLLESAKWIEKEKKNEIKQQEKSDYFIGTLSNDEDFYYMFRGTILNYVTNDVVEGVRDAFFRKYKIKIVDRKPKAERVHCLKASSYKFTTEKIAKLMQLALLNHSKNIINDRILFLFELFINLEEKTKQEEYKKITKKHIKQAFKEMLEEDNKTETLACCTMSHAEEIMQEMGWFSIE